MFGIGMPELIVILVVALVVLGPKRLPEMARTIGKAMAELRRQTADIMDEFQVQAMLDDDAPPRRPAAAPPTPSGTATSQTPPAAAPEKPEPARS